MEQYTRTKINTQLTNLGWILEGSNKNVFQEEPRTKEEKRKLGRLRPDYVLYASTSQRYEPLAIIEAKTYKTKGLDGAIAQAEKYAQKLKAPIVFATDGVYYHAKHVIDKKHLIYNGEEVSNLIKEEIILGFLKSYELDTRPKEVKISQSNLIKIFKEINSLLRKDGLLAGHERFSEFATILFLKLFSEREKQAGYNRLAKPYSWEHLKTLESKELLGYLSNSIFPTIANLYKDKNIFDHNLRITDNIKFKQIYDKLDALELSYINEDIKGGAFEYFIASAPSSSKDLGEYFTPRHIVKTMVAMLDPQIGEKVYDPFCGTGGMLIESYKHIYSTMEQTKANKDKLENNTLYGRELTSNTRIAKMNMILAGDGHNKIKQCDSLAPDNFDAIKGKFDVVITNPPFSQNTDHQAIYDIPSSEGDSICLQHCIKALKAGGRMAVVVPEGVLFKKSLKTTRQYLLEHCHIDHIVSLPEGVFEPYAGVKTNILHCTKKKAAGKVWFYQIKNDGFSLDKWRRKLNQRSDLDRFLSFANIGDKDKTNFGFTPVDVAQIRAKDYSLMLNDYTAQNISARFKWSMVQLGDLCNIMNGYAFKSELYTKTGIKLIRISNLKDGRIISSKHGYKYYSPQGEKKIERFLLRENDLLISLTGNTGQVALVTLSLLPALLNQRVGCIRIKEHERVTKEYLFYILKNHHFISQCNKLSKGVAQKNISINDIKKLAIPLPPLEEQKKIVKKIKNHQNIIEKNKKIIEMTKEKIQSNIRTLWEV